MSASEFFCIRFENPRPERRGQWLFPVADLILDRSMNAAAEIIRAESIPLVLRGAVWPSRSGKALDRTLSASSKAAVAHFAKHGVRLDPADVADFLGREMLLKAHEVAEAALPPNGKAALHCARHFGWAVFPVHEPLADGTCSCGDPNCANIGKHPRTKHGLNDATTDAATIIHWWWQWPDANIGFVLGKRSGVVAIDEDPRHSGDEALAKLEADHGALPETAEALTGGGGRHILFACPDGGCPTHDLGPGLELRGDGSYIVVAPSLHKSGRRYEWEAAHHPDDVPLAPLPAWVLGVADAKSGQGARQDARLDPAQVLAGVPEGQRDRTLFRYACRLRTLGLAREEAEGLVLKAAQACQPPFPEADALAKVANAWTYPSEKAEIEAALVEARELLEGLADRASDDPGAPFEAESLRALLLVRDHDAPSWARVLKRLTDAGVRLRDLTRAMKQAAGLSQRQDDAEGEAEAESANGHTPKLPEILANRRQLRDVTDDALGAVLAASTPPTVFQRGSTWVRLRFDERGAPGIDTMSDDAVRGHLSRVADWFEEQGKGDNVEAVPAFPPVAVVDDLLALPDQHLPPLTAVVQAPTFDPHGVLIVTPGYHAEAGLYVHFALDFKLPEVPAAPKVEDVQRARGLLLDEMLHDFPFDGQASRANAVAMILLPCVRLMIDGPTPLHLIEAPQAGTGKSLLVEVGGIVAGETAPAIMTEKSGWANGPDEAEWRKAITSGLLAGKQIIRIDNVRNGLDSAQLSAALTCTMWEDRILGHSRQASVPVTCLWIATGNNVTLSTEMSRRAVPIRLDARVDRPWEREGFRHALPGWAIQHRADLAWACLVLVQAWIAAERPADPSVRVLGSFPAWTATMGGILQVAGIPGFLADQDRMYERADTEGSMWRQFIEGAWWPTHAGAAAATRDLRTLAADSDMLGSVLGQGEERSQTTKLGKALGKLRDRVYGGYRIESGKLDHSNRATWQLVPVAARTPADVGSGDKDITREQADGRRGADNLCATSARGADGQSARIYGISAGSAEVAEVAEVVRGSGREVKFPAKEPRADGWVRDAGHQGQALGDAGQAAPDDQPHVAAPGGNSSSANGGEDNLCTSADEPRRGRNPCSDTIQNPAEVAQRCRRGSPTSAPGGPGIDLRKGRL